MDLKLVEIVSRAAAAHGLDRHILCGQAERESSWNPRAIRYEPAFRDRYLRSLHLELTEEIARAQSYGLGQVMGEVAREMGYVGELAALCDPELGAEWQARVLAHKIAVNGGDIEKGLEAYNGGGNPNYAAEVLELSKKYL
ncbi:MAG TPA: transglycosylase SLT domain-containing protein [Candidatus Acidoferrum sp.]|nr:transglycosylase SLT domain-containing protein [Candidatus Acidoferrum sp.]